MKYITMTIQGIYGSTIDAQSDEEARTILGQSPHNDEILDIQEAGPFNADLGADFIVVVEG
jgi:hypothetical protein